MELGETRSQRANRNIQTLLDYFLRRKLMGQQYGLMGEQEEKEQAGRIELEQIKGKNIQERTWQDWLYKISQEPEIQRSQSEIFIRKQRGHDTRGLEDELNKTILNIGSAALRSVKGELTQSDMPQLMRLSDMTTRSLLGEYGETTRQKERIEKVEAPGIVLREKELGVRRGELRAREAEGGKEYYRNIHAKSSGVLSYLDRLKEEGGGIDIARFLSSGELTSAKSLVGGALTPETLSNLMSKISTLDTKAMRQTLTPQEESFIDNAYDIFGYKSSIEDAVMKLKNYILEEAAARGLQITPEDAERRARERLGGGRG